MESDICLMGILDLEGKFNETYVTCSVSTDPLLHIGHHLSMLCIPAPSAFRYCLDSGQDGLQGFLI